MSKSCQRCGADFSPRSHRAMYCGDRCRNAANYAKRNGIGVPALTVAPPLPVSDDDDTNPETGALARVTLRDVRAAGAEGDVLAVLALILARSIDTGSFTGSGLTALSREYTRVITDIRTAYRPAVDSPLDVIRRRREARKST